MFELLTSIFVLSASHNVDPYLVAAVVQTESKFNANAIGGVGEIGLMQLRPEYFAGPKGRKELFNPLVNLERGITYLKDVKEGCRHKEGHTFLVCYNAGIAGGSKIKHPRQFDYYQRVQQQYEKFKLANVFKPVQLKLFAKGWAYELNPRIIPVLPARTLASKPSGCSLIAKASLPIFPFSILVYSERRKKFERIALVSLKKLFSLFI